MQRWRGWSSPKKKKKKDWGHLPLLFWLRDPPAIPRNWPFWSSFFQIREIEFLWFLVELKLTVWLITGLRHWCHGGIKGIAAACGPFVCFFFLFLRSVVCVCGLQAFFCDTHRRAVPDVCGGKAGVHSTRGIVSTLSLLLLLAQAFHFSSS